ncbi:MAG: hypothetical protein IT214_14790 [Chitinophagaceae bacterium]|nr:hypothetical protein [Chitinophagaceae bacterium]
MKEGYMKVFFRKIFIVYFTVLLFNDCNGPQVPTQNAVPNNSTVISVQYKKPPSGLTDTLAINYVAAIFFKPDSIQLEKIKSIKEKNIYETEVHNCFFLLHNARQVINKYWPGVHITETSKVRYLLFVKTDKRKTIIDLDNKNDDCGIILFNRKKDPELVDMMNIDTALGFYFGK